MDLECAAALLRIQQRDTAALWIGQVLALSTANQKRRRFVSTPTTQLRAAHSKAT